MKNDTKRKQMRELALNILDAQLKDGDELKARLEELGLDTTISASVLLAQVDRAQRGEVDSAKFLRDTSGQKPVDGLAIGNLDGKPFETTHLAKLSDAELTALIAAEEPEKA